MGSCALPQRSVAGVCAVSPCLHRGLSDHIAVFVHVCVCECDGLKGKREVPACLRGSETVEKLVSDNANTRNVGCVCVRVHVGMM